MGPLDALWHLLNFFAPAAGVALFTTALAKLVWRRELAGASWGRLLAWGVAFAATSAGGGATQHG